MARLLEMLLVSKDIIVYNAIVMTVGLATEFLSKEQAIKYYGENGPSGYSDIIPDFHRSRLVLP